MHPAVVGCSGRRVLIIGVVVFLIRRHRSWVKIVVTLARICVLPVGLGCHRQPRRAAVPRVRLNCRRPLTARCGSARDSKTQSEQRFQAAGGLRTHRRRG